MLVTARNKKKKAAETDTAALPVGSNVELELSDLVSYPNNPREHDESNIAAIVASLSRFGQVEPLVVSSRTRRIIGGNGRRAAMERLGLTRAWCNVVDLEPAQESALVVALNRTAELASWNYDALVESLTQASAAGELSFTGFSDDDLARMVGSLTHEGVAEAMASAVSGRTQETAGQRSLNSQELAAEGLVVVRLGSAEEASGLCAELMARGLGARAC